LTALDVFLDAFIDKNLSELIFGICDIEEVFRLECVFECFIIIIEIEVEFSE
jgi:hypothetical protein